MRKSLQPLGLAACLFILGAATASAGVMSDSMFMVGGNHGAAAPGTAAVGGSNGAPAPEIGASMLGLALAGGIAAYLQRRRRG
ncbi:MAG TPA: hypothetical protein VEK34_08925 [Methylocella sp.]|nr:hypothetical protein [Methylocella sp.]